MKVLLVDDEKITLELLKTLIPWEELGLEAAGCAQDGEEACELIQKENPDIVITDIRMQNMDGLQLTERIRVYSPNIKVILMSAFAEFEYVKEGMRLGCSNYILKPIDEQELISTLKKTMEEIQAKQNAKEIVDKSEKQLRMMDLYKYMNRGSNLKKVKEHEDGYAISFLDYTVVILQGDSGSIDDYINIDNIGLLEEGYVQRTLEEYVKEKYGKKFLSFQREEDAWVVLVEDCTAAELKEMGVRLVEYFRSALGLEIRVSFSERGAGVEMLPKLYEEADSLRKYAFYIGEEQVLSYEENCREKEFEKVREIGLLRDAEQAVKEHDSTLLKELIDKMFQSSASYHPGILQDICEFCYQILYMIRRELENTGKEEQVAKLAISYEEIQKNGSEKFLRGIMDQALHSMESCCEKKQEERFSKPVEESLKIIEENYNKNLSLDEISDAIAVSKNYFCYMFKREVGISIWNYLTQVRLKRAKELLETTEMKTYEIAFQVGYDNPSYFSKIFKKTESMTPNEYRESKR